MLSAPQLWWPTVIKVLAAAGLVGGLKYAGVGVTVNVVSYLAQSVVDQEGQVGKQILAVRED